MTSRLKRCSKCKKIKNVKEFHRNRHFVDGLCYWCKECTNDSNRKSYNKFRKIRIDKHREWEKSNPEKRRISVNTRYRVMKDMIIKAYGGKCCKCGFQDIRALHIDHIKGNGIIDRKKMPPATFLRSIINNNYPDIYQILCANCNSIKMYENKEFPGWSSKEVF